MCAPLFGEGFKGKGFVKGKGGGKEVGKGKGKQKGNEGKKGKGKGKGKGTPYWQTRDNYAESSNYGPWKDWWKSQSWEAHVDEEPDHWWGGDSSWTAAGSAGVEGAGAPTEVQVQDGSDASAKSITGPASGAEANEELALLAKRAGEEFRKMIYDKKEGGQTTAAGAAAMPGAGADKAAGQPPPNRASSSTALAVAPGPPPLPAAGPTSPQECQHERDTAGYIQHVQGGHYCRLCKRWAENAHLQSDTHKENCAQYAHLAPEDWYPELSADGKVVLPSDEQASVATAVAAAGGAPARASEAGIAGAAAGGAPAAPAAAGNPFLTQTQSMWRAQWGVECRLAFVEMILGIDQTLVDANLEAAWYAAPPGLEPSE